MEKFSLTLSSSQKPFVTDAFLISLAQGLRPLIYLKELILEFERFDLFPLFKKMRRLGKNNLAITEKGITELFGQIGKNDKLTTLLLNLSE